MGLVQPPTSFCLPQFASVYDCCRWNTTIPYPRRAPLQAQFSNAPLLNTQPFQQQWGQPRTRVSRGRLERRFLRKKQKTSQKMWPFPCFLGPKNSEVKLWNVFSSSAYDELRGKLLEFSTHQHFMCFSVGFLLLAHLKTKDTKIQTEISQRIWEYFWMLHLESTKIFWGVQDKGFFILGKDSNSAGELKFPKFFDKTWNLFFWICVSVVGVCSYFRGEKPVKTFVEMLFKECVFLMKFCLNEAVEWFVWRIPKKTLLTRFLILIPSIFEEKTLDERKKLKSKTELRKRNIKTKSYIWKLSTNKPQYNKKGNSTKKTSSFPPPFKASCSVSTDADASTSATSSTNGGSKRSTHGATSSGATSAAIGTQPTCTISTTGDSNRASSKVGDLVMDGMVVGGLVGWNFLEVGYPNLDVLSWWFF